MMDSMGFNDCLLFIKKFGTDCFALFTTILTLSLNLQPFWLFLRMYYQMSITITQCSQSCQCQQWTITYFSWQGSALTTRYTTSISQYYQFWYYSQCYILLLVGQRSNYQVPLLVLLSTTSSGIIYSATYFFWQGSPQHTCLRGRPEWLGWKRERVKDNSLTG